MLKSKVVIQFIFTSGKVTKFTYGEIEQKNFEELKRLFIKTKEDIAESKKTGKILEIQNKENTGYLFVFPDQLSQFNIFLDDRNYDNFN